MRSGLLGGQPAPDGPLLHGGTGSPGGRPPGVRRALSAPAADPCRRTDRPVSGHPGGCAGQLAAGSAVAARFAGLRLRSAQRRCRGGLLRAVSRRSTGGRAAADVDPPPATAPPRGYGWTSAGPTGRSPSAPGGARPTVGGTGTARWQADVGTAALPWLGDHQVHGVAAAAWGCLLRDGFGGRGKACSPRVPRCATSGSTNCCCSTLTPRSPPSQPSTLPASQRSPFRPTTLGNSRRTGPAHGCGPARRSPTGFSRPAPRSRRHTAAHPGTVQWR